MSSLAVLLTAFRFFVARFLTGAAVLLDFAELGLATLEKCCLRSGLACGDATTLLTEEGPEFDCERFHGGSCATAGAE